MPPLSTQFDGRKAVLSRARQFRLPCWDCGFLRWSLRGFRSLALRLQSLAVDGQRSSRGAYSRRCVCSEVTSNRVRRSLYSAPCLYTKSTTPREVYRNFGHGVVGRAGCVLGNDSYARMLQESRASNSGDELARRAFSISRCLCTSVDLYDRRRPAGIVDLYLATRKALSPPISMQFTNLGRGETWFEIGIYYVRNSWPKNATVDSIDQKLSLFSS